MAVLLCIGAFGYVLLAARLLQGPREAGDLHAALTALAMAPWLLGGAFQLHIGSEFAYSVGRLAHVVGAALGSVAFLLTALACTGKAVSRSTRLAFLIVPITSILVVATNEHHLLMWSLPVIDGSGETLARPAVWGAWYLFAHAPYSYGVVIAAVLTLLLHSVNLGRAQKRGLFALAAAVLVPVVAALAWDVGLGSSTLPFVPLVLASMLPVYAWLMIARRVTEFSPIAYESVFRNIADPLIVVDDRGRVLRLNREAESLLHVREAGAFRQPLTALFGDYLPGIEATLEGGDSHKLISSTGRFLQITVSPLESVASARGGRVLSLHAVGDTARTDRDAGGSDILLRTLFDHTVNGLVRLRWRTDDPSGTPVLRCVSANGAAAGFLGIDADDVVDMPADRLLEIATGGMPSQDAEDICERFCAAVTARQVLDVEVRPKDDAPGRWLRMIGEAVDDKVAITLIDATGTKAREEKMESMAITDALTGVLNRRGFEQRASAYLAEISDEAKGALLFIDLNQFKQINDRCGHGAGDELLRIAAERLQRSLRPRDIVGRPGGDEFVALVPSVTADIAGDLAERLVDALEQPYHIDGHTLYCSASIGMALYPEHATTLTGLLRSADEAMYRAKSRTYGTKKAGRRHLLERAG
jgi:diguanylate cyclase (GGDEF)-like protein